jgi:hypothetical protein
MPQRCQQIQTLRMSEINSRLLWQPGNAEPDSARKQMLWRGFCMQRQEATEDLRAFPDRPAAKIRTELRNEA